MKRASSWVAAGAVLMGLACPPLARSAGAQLTPQALQHARILAQQTASSFQSYVEGAGVYISEANVASRKAWAVVVGNPPLSVANAGFKLPPMSAEGPIPNARVKATFNVLQVIGAGTQVCLGVYKSGAQTGSFPGTQSGVLKGPGPVTLTSDAFTMQPGVHYEARAFLVSLPDIAGGGINAGIAMVTDIKWEF